MPKPSPMDETLLSKRNQLVHDAAGTDVLIKNHKEQFEYYSRKAAEMRAEAKEIEDYLRPKGYKV